MADSRAGQAKGRMTLEHPIVSESKENSKELWVHANGTQELAERCSLWSNIGQFEHQNKEFKRIHELIINKGLRASSSL